MKRKTPKDIDQKFTDLMGAVLIKPAPTAKGKTNAS